MDGPARTAVGPVLAALALGALVAVGAGCRKSDDAPAGPTGPPPMSEAEQARGLEACRSYAERVCRCARSDKTLADACSFASARPEALETTLGLVNEGYGKMAINDQIATQTAARRIIGKCFEADAKLDPGACPRTAPDPAPELDSESAEPAEGPASDDDQAAPAAANE